MTQSGIGDGCAGRHWLKGHQFSEVDVLDHGKLGEYLWVVQKVSWSSYHKKYLEWF